LLPESRIVLLMVNERPWCSGAWINAPEVKPSPPAT
jgi:hypothetical protein